MTKLGKFGSAIISLAIIFAFIFPLVVQPIAAYAAVKYPWVVRAFGGTTNLWQCPATGSNAGEIQPGTTLASDIGDSTHKVRNITTGNETVSGVMTLAQVVETPNSITGNTTLTVANGSLSYLTTVSGNITVTIPSAVTAGNGLWK